MEVPTFIEALLAYAIIGNVAAYVLMSRRGVPMKSVWAGTPGYLYKACRDSDVDSGCTARFLAFTSSLAFLIGFPWVVIVSSMIPHT